MKQRTSKTIGAAAIAATLLAGAGALATPTPQQACQAAKSKAAGKYAACRQGAEAKLVTTGDVPKYTANLAKCGSQFTAAWQKAIDRAALLGATCPDDPLSASDFQTIINTHTTKVASGLAGLGLQVCSAATRLKTGQTSCWDGMGLGIPCGTTGQDGQLQKGIARSYTDNSDGTITDNITGLMWEKLSDDSSIHDKDDQYTWASAFTTKIAMLNGTSFAGYTDWRLPNINELQTLTNYALTPTIDAPFDAGCTGGCSVTTCSCTKLGFYWSSTTFLPTKSHAWGVAFNLGGLDHVLKTGTDSVRAVRETCVAASRPLKTGQTTCWDSGGLQLDCAGPGAGQDGAVQAGIARSYADNGDGTITDNNTGLTWEKLGNDGSIHDKDTTYTWDDAFAVKIATLNTMGFAGRTWRLPNVNELQSLVDYGTVSPAVSAAFNSGCAGACANTGCSCTRTAGFYWSSTTYEPATSGGWGSFFDRGNLEFGSKAVGDFVRAVSGGS